MSEQESGFWTAYSERLAVHWTDGSATPVGLVMYGEVTATALRDVQLSRLARTPKGHPTWPGERPPSPKDLAHRWRASAGVRARSAIGEAMKASQPGPTLPDVLRQSPAALLAVRKVGPMARQDGETADGFYRRVADAYRVLSTATGKPTQSIAEAGNVPKTTAARWVREARLRGHLEPTTRGKGRTS